ncbi:MAG: VOC family protein [Alphaproteobacteria bacterium]|nr:VOC family protein [Alphaproteobacteria bacterium]
MLNIVALDHVVFRARDVPAMMRFYEQVLGARLERILEEYGLWQLRLGNALIDLVDVEGKLGRQGGAPPGVEGRNVDHVCLQVLPWDGEAVLAHLAAHGLTEAQISTRYGAQGYGPSVYITDPEGNTIELKGPPDPVQPPA